jgi:hypothetical protein
MAREPERIAPAETAGTPEESTAAIDEIGVGARLVTGHHAYPPDGRAVIVIRSRQAAELYAGERYPWLAGVIGTAALVKMARAIVFGP